MIVTSPKQSIISVTGQQLVTFVVKMGFHSVNTQRTSLKVTSGDDRTSLLDFYTFSLLSLFTIPPPSCHPCPAAPRSVRMKNTGCKMTQISAEHLGSSFTIAPSSIQPDAALQTVPVIGEAEPRELPRALQKPEAPEEKQVAKQQQWPRP